MNEMAWLVKILWGCLAVDIVVVYLTRRKKLELRNTYFDLHKKHGFVKSRIFKIFIVCFCSLLFINDPMDYPASASLTTILYFVSTLKLMVDYFSAPINKSGVQKV